MDYEEICAGKFDINTLIFCTWNTSHSCLMINIKRCIVYKCGMGSIFIAKIVFSRYTTHYEKHPEFLHYRAY